ncbi:MAG: tetratricopeptide repeat protein, partial [Bdellovibrionales bacterium]|nr:tetratricopeptide repeat protein [Bdellovibrionales bacterium]
LLEKKATKDAIEQLQKASELSPDNILAFQLLGETYLETKRPKDALKAFKMVLFLNPLHERARKMVKKWEFLTADEFEESDFEWTPKEDDAVPTMDPSATQEMQKDPNRADREAYRAISIADALTVRNDLEGAYTILTRSLKLLGGRPDLEQRLMLLGKRLGMPPEDMLPQAKAERTAEPANTTAKKKERLKKMLHRLKKNR